MVLHIDFPCFYIYLPSSNTQSSYLNLLNVNFYILIFSLSFILFSLFYYYFFFYIYIWTLAALCSHLGNTKNPFQTTHRLCVISDIPAFVYVSSFKPERKQASIHTQISAYITLCVFVYVSVCPAL